MVRKKVTRNEKIKRWQHAVKLVAKTSYLLNKMFQKHSRLKQIYEQKLTAPKKDN